MLLYRSIASFVLMISRCNWFIGTVFFVAAFGALMNPPPYVAIALLFWLIGMMFLPTTDKLTRSYFKWRIKGGVKGMIILASLLIVCAIVPQVETNAAVFTSPLEDLKNELRLS